MGIPSPYISYKRNYYYENLVQVSECTQVLIIYTNVFTYLFAYTLFVIKDFAISTRGWNEALHYFTSAMWTFLSLFNAAHVFVSPN